MELQILKQNFTVCKIDNMNHLNFKQDFMFLAKTDDEISLVCESSHVPLDAIASETGWKALKISGILDLGLIGVIANIANILAKAEISIFTLSTYNTDYILLKAENLNKCIQTLTDNGYIVK
jgi:hypothetical protein